MTKDGLKMLGYLALAVLGGAALGGIMILIFKPL